MSWPESPSRQRIAKRRLVACAVLAVIGLWVAAVWWLSARPVFSPGKLTRHHNSLARDCAACHAIASTDASAWSEAGWDRRTQERALCKACHDFGPFTHHAHGVDPHNLAVVTARLQRDVVGNANTAIPPHAAQGADQIGNDSLYCRDCHREHQGSRADMAMMTDRQCQTCHVRDFHSFGNGHPKFSNYPYKRRTRIYFDHMTHYGTHFANFERTKPNGEAPQSCGACHRLDELGDQRLAGGFDQMCGSCHGQQIDDATFGELALFALPALDLAALRTKQLPIGEWPAVEASHVADDALPPLMRLLLGSDQGFADVDATLRDIDLLVLDDASPEQLDAVVNCIWDVKQLLYDLTKDGPSEVGRRVAAAGPNTRLAELAELSNIPPAVFVSAQRRWFPNLEAELERRHGGDPAALLNDAVDEPVESNPTMHFFGGWYVDDRNASIRYRPSQHADRFLRAWLEFSARVVLADPTESAGDLEFQPSLYGQARRSIFRSLTRSTSPGRCMKCHTVDATVDGRFHINWSGSPTVSDELEDTKFSHLPHVSQAEENCTSCHKLDEEIDFFRAEYLHSDLAANVDPHSVNTSGFRPIQTTDCTGCHSRQGGARDTCLTCHNYHRTPSRRLSE
ncbi:hypothetical protein OAS39_01260 [Pirellulales bacterium]|nr:hypothetical protein [Pirellulales bacterium]